jgi:hypothetical protein
MTDVCGQNLLNDATNPGSPDKSIPVIFPPCSPTGEPGVFGRKVMEWAEVPGFSVETGPITPGIGPVGFFSFLSSHIIALAGGVVAGLVRYCGGLPTALPLNPKFRRAVDDLFGITGAFDILPGNKQQRRG